MLDSSDKSKSLVCFAHDIYNVITPGQIFTQYYTQVLEGDSFFERTVVDNLSRNNIAVASCHCLSPVLRPSHANFRVAKSKKNVCFLRHENLLRAEVVIRATDNRNLHCNIVTRQVARKSVF